MNETQYGVGCADCNAESEHDVDGVPLCGDCADERHTIGLDDGISYTAEEMAAHGRIDETSIHWDGDATYGAKEG